MNFDVLSFLLFIPAAISAFVIPGDLLVRPLKLKLFERGVLATTVGIVLWALQGLLFGYFGARWLTYIYLLGALLIWVKLNFKDRSILKKFSLKKIEWDVLALILAGTILSLTAVWFLGYKTADGIRFCCRSEIDIIYHLALSNQLVKDIPPIEPGLAGVTVRNYHYLSNIVVGELGRVFKLDLMRLQFQYMSIVLGLLLGSSAFVLAKALDLKKSFAIFLAIFLYAQGDILYLLTFVTRGTFDFSFTVVDNATVLLSSPPRAFSVVILIVGLSALVLWLKKQSLVGGIIVAILFGSLIGFKVYSGIFALTGLGFLGLYFLLKRRLWMLWPILLTFLISAAVYLPVNSQAGGIEFIGFWRFENFAVNEKLGLRGLELARLAFLADGKFLQVAFFEVVFVVLYFTFLGGTVMVGLFQTKKSLAILPKELNIFLISGLLTTTVAGTFFFQKTGGANTIQFIIGTFTFMAIYSTLSVYFWSSRLNRSLKYIFIVAVIVLTLPRAIQQYAQNIQRIQGTYGPFFKNGELALLEKISQKNTNDKDGRFLLLDPTIHPNEGYLVASYITNRPLYLGGENLLKDHGYDVKDRKNFFKLIDSANDARELADLLKSQNVGYVFSVSNWDLPFDEKYFKKHTSDDGIYLYEVLQ